MHCSSSDGRNSRGKSEQIRPHIFQISCKKSTSPLPRTHLPTKKTTIEHPAVLTCLQTILSYFNIINLIPLLENIINKILSYVGLAQNNSYGYKIKAEASNCLALIGEQLDQGGVAVQEKVIKALEDLATDKVWAVQATGRKALNVWKSKKK